MEDRAWERAGLVGQLRQTLYNKDASIGPPLRHWVLVVVLTTFVVRVLVPRVLVPRLPSTRRDLGGNGEFGLAAAPRRRAGLTCAARAGGGWVVVSRGW